MPKASVIPFIVIITGISNTPDTNPQKTANQILLQLPSIKQLLSATT